MVEMLAAYRHDVEAAIIGRQDDLELVAAPRQGTHCLFDLDWNILMPRKLIRSSLRPANEPIARTWLRPQAQRSVLSVV